MAESGRETRTLLVGDPPGVTQLLQALPPSGPVGIVGASNRSQYHDELAAIAADRGVPFLVQQLPQSDAYGEFVESTRALQPDLILCNSYSMILREDLLAIAPRGGVNVHGGKLPEFRGPNPVQWAIIEGARETAATMHVMTPELDAGGVIAERRVPIRFADTWRDVLGRLRAATEELLGSELPSVLAGTAVSRPQDESVARHRPRRRAEDGRIDWSWTVARIYDLVRALGDGIPPAFYEERGNVVAVEGLSLGDVTALAFEPHLGARRLVRGDVRLVPAGGELVDFRVLRQGVETAVVRLAAIDLDARVVRLRVEPDDEDAAALAAEFARTELGFTVGG